jgi:site-specific DNA recombinase
LVRERYSNGWLILEEHLYSDEAIAATSMAREGLQRLLAAAAAPERAFDCILIDDTSRLTRKLTDALNLYEKLTFAGVRLVAVSQGVDSDSSQAELLIGVHGLIDAVYWRELAQKPTGECRGSLGGLSHRRSAFRLFVRQSSGRKCPAGSELKGSRNN